jgi:hypothetical protein
MRKFLPLLLFSIIPIFFLYFSCDKQSSEEKPQEVKEDGGEEGGVDGGTIITSGNVALATVGKIVQVVDPVLAYPATDNSPEAVEARAFGQLAISAELTTAAKIGVSLGKSTSDIKSSFDSAQGSKAFCDSVNNGMKFFKEASAPDFNLCAIKIAAKKSTIVVTDDGARSNAINSGEQRIWDFKVSGAEGAQKFRMKFRIDTDENGGVKFFENFSCGAQGNMPLTQEGYSKQTVVDGKVKVHARSFGNKGDGFKMRVEMEGKLDSNGKLIGLKKIDYAEKLADKTVRSKVTQSANDLEVIGYYSEGRVTQYLNFIELLDKNDDSSPYAVTKIAYGDGAALLAITQHGSTTDVTQGWNGDTLKVNSSEPRLQKVTGRESDLLSPEGDTLDLDFAESEIYDCSGEAEYTMNATMEDFQDCLNAYEIDQEGSQMCTNLIY